MEEGRPCTYDFDCTKIILMAFFVYAISDPRPGGAVYIGCTKKYWTAWKAAREANKKKDEEK